MSVEPNPGPRPIGPIFIGLGSISDIWRLDPVLLGSVIERTGGGSESGPIRSSGDRSECRADLLKYFVDRPS